MSETPENEQLRNSPTPGATFPYVVPMILFMVITYLEGSASKNYPFVYILKCVLVTIALIYYRSSWKDIRPDNKVIVPGVVVGLFVLLEWILIENWLKYPHLGTRTAYNPFVEISNSPLRYAFIAIRLSGLSLMVPVMEELFWRSFVIRFLSDPDWEKLPVGKFSWAGFAFVCGLFGLAHPEWLPAVICAAAYGLLLKQTKSLYACVIAHAVTNLALGIYVLTAHDWKFW